MRILVLNYQVDEFMGSVATKNYECDTSALKEIIQNMICGQWKAEQARSADKQNGVCGPAPSSSSSPKGSNNIVPTLQSFVTHVARHRHVQNATLSGNAFLRNELLKFLLAHIAQIEDNVRLRHQQPCSTTTIFLQHRSSYYERARTTAADNTSCPYSVVFFSCLLSALIGVECFPSAHAKRYNDYDSIARDKAEQNLSSVNFPDGNYRIFYCTTHSVHISQLLHSIWTTIGEALEHLEAMGPEGTTLYNTFFHDAEPNKIKDVLSRIAAGDNIAFRGRFQPPLIICEDSSVPAVARSAAHAACQRDPGAQALWGEDTHGIFLCQKYLQNKRVIPNEKQCVGWNRLSTGMLLGETQWTILFHELVHLYLGVPSLVPEVRNIFEVQELGSEHAVINPASYGFFLANIKAGCKKFRPKASLRAHGRLLSDNSTFDIDEPAQDYLIRNETAKNCGEVCLWGVT
ncbi:MAG: hypothetical protein Q9195_007336 [Heterodermia aff. obscurata]